MKDDPKPVTLMLTAAQRVALAILASHCTQTNGVADQLARGQWHTAVLLADGRPLGDVNLTTTRQL